MSPTEYDYDRECEEIDEHLRKQALKTKKVWLRDSITKTLEEKNDG